MLLGTSNVSRETQSSCLQDNSQARVSQVHTCATSYFQKIAKSVWGFFKRLVHYSFALISLPLVSFRACNKELVWTTKVCEKIGQYFLAPYEEGSYNDIAQRWINGKKYVVQRYNHGLGHGLRQGALAKDIADLIGQLKKETLDDLPPQVQSLVTWIEKKRSQDPDFLSKLEMASSFQRSGRQKEGSSAAFPETYKKYELQDAMNFREAALKSPLFKIDKEVLVFQEAILWLNQGTLDEQKEEDLKFLRRILHAAHIFDLRRMLLFDEARIKKDGLEQLFGIKVDLSEPLFGKVAETLWKRSGAYLYKTGDRDLVSGRNLQDDFFIQSNDPKKLVEAIYAVRKHRIALV